MMLVIEEMSVDHMERGGYIGYLYGDLKDVILTNCQNLSEETSSTGNCVGGFIGYIHASSYNSSASVCFKNCKNTSMVSSDYGSTFKFAGGFCGIISFGSKKGRFNTS